MSSSGTIASWLKHHKENLANLRGQDFYKRNTKSAGHEFHDIDEVPLKYSQKMSESERLRILTRAQKETQSRRTSLILSAAYALIIFIIIVVYFSGIIEGFSYEAPRLRILRPDL
jgi:hypothetical protein